MYPALNMPCRQPKLHQIRKIIKLVSQRQAFNVSCHIMRPLQLYIAFLLLVFLIACGNSTKNDSTNKLPKGSVNPPITREVKYQGDSLRIGIEKRGNMLIKHYIDLNGTKDDNFDGSFTVTSYYKRKDVDSVVIVDNNKLRIQAVLIEDYQTEFSKGKNYYFIKLNGDTVLGHHLLEWIK